VEIVVRRRAQSLGLVLALREELEVVVHHHDSLGLVILYDIGPLGRDGHVLIRLRMDRGPRPDILVSLDLFIRTKDIHALLPFRRQAVASQRQVPTSARGNNDTHIKVRCLGHVCSSKSLST
jgi:hypothetical protein